MAQIYGKKLWLIGGADGALPDRDEPCNFRKRASEAGSRTSRNEKERQTEVPRKTKGDAKFGAKGASFRCITGPSDILYLPDGWSHATCGLSNFNVGIGFIGSVAFLPAMHRAAVRGNLEMAKRALKDDKSGGLAMTLQPAGGGMLNEAGLIPFHWAAWNGHLALSKLLLQEELRMRLAIAAATRPSWSGEDEFNQHWEHSQEHQDVHNSIAHALRWAAARGHRSVTAFLANQVGPEARDEQGATPLHWAATTGHVEVLKHLLRMKADPNVADHFGARPLHFLAGEGHLAAVTLLPLGATLLRATLVTRSY
ncbi:unnamed protein product [Durusdinium trenchii]|uniref:Uncharacterized protein n=1 Tax=Durusdinium trenchii TaxID=1381693 RepID=A0ABP0SXK1_9DINO